MGEDEYMEIFGLTGESTGDGGDPAATQSRHSDAPDRPDEGSREETGNGTEAPAGDGAGEQEPEAAEDRGEDTAQGKADRPPDAPRPGNTPKPADTAPPGEGRGDRGPRSTPAPENTDAYLDEVIRGLGMTDPYSGKPVTSRAEYEEYKRRAFQERREAIMRKSGMTQAEFDAFVSELPEVRQARLDSAAAQEAIRQQREREARQRIDADIARISAMDPGIKTLEDLMRQDNYSDIYGYVKRGLSLTEAYTLTNAARLQQRAADAARQAVHNSNAGRAGLVRSGTRGTGSERVAVPKDVMELYRAVNPGASDEEIRRYYNEYVSGKK